MINFSVVHNSLFILLSIIFILSTINPLKHRYEPIIDIEPQIIKIKFRSEWKFGSEWYESNF